MTDVRDNCRRVMERIHEAAVKSGRESKSVTLVAVTKTVDAGRVREAAESGITNIGENKLQEAVAKKPLLLDLNLTWHFIGHLQTNKARKVVDIFEWVQSVDRIELAEKLAQHASRQLPILIEVELGQEPTKSGVNETHLETLLHGLRAFDRLDVRGLMTIPPYSDDPERTRQYFRRLRELAEKHQLAELSMGMSHDFEVAIEEGATMVRVGTALFGARQ
jgi:pyridoxal phosphate enzyme (YggS family)